MDVGESGAEVRYTSKAESLYVIVMNMPANGIITLPLEMEGSVTLLETGNRLRVERSAEKLFITLPHGMKSTSIPVLKIQNKE
jgi:hypothetical protein